MCIDIQHHQMYKVDRALDAITEFILELSMHLTSFEESYPREQRFASSGGIRVFFTEVHPNLVEK